MEDLTNNSSTGTCRKVKIRAKKYSTKIDMTPMVDLMSLLITFFMLTTAFIKPKIMEIVLPQDGEGNGQSIAPRTLHLLLGANDKIYYYIGKPPESNKDVNESVNRVQMTNYSKDGLRKILLKMNLTLFEKVDSANQYFISGRTDISQDSIKSLIKLYKKQDKKGPVVMIKADKKAKYRNIVDAVDEMAICNIARYAIVNPSEYELKLIENVPQ